MRRASAKSAYGTEWSRLALLWDACVRSALRARHSNVPMAIGAHRKGSSGQLKIQTIQNTNDQYNAVVYVDYENIFQLLGRYGADPLEINFFPIILRKLKEKYRLNVIDFVVYSNFERKPFADRHQTIIQAMGLETRHSANSGKNSGDLELTVDALRTLYKNPTVKVFVIISSDRDIIPLLKAIRYENRVTCVMSTRNGFNQIVTEYADHHEYLEDIFHLTMVSTNANEENAAHVERELIEMDENAVLKAKEVARLLYRSKIWRNYERLGDPVSLDGYAKTVARTLREEPAQISRHLKLAHYLKYITIYQDAKKGLCLREGVNRTEL